MGIHGFVSQVLLNWARRNPALHGIFSREVPRGVSSLAIDANGLIHAAKNIAMGSGNIIDESLRIAMASKTYTQRLSTIKKSFQNQLEEVVNNITPQDTLIISVDGVVPMAKISQQRERRYRTAIHGIDELFDSNSITTGTDFMFELDDYIMAILENVRGRFPRNVIYSSHLDPGEGEHKIMEYYRNGVVEENKTDARYHVLYGMDADLIMLSLLSPQDDIVLVREKYDNVLFIDNLRDGLIKSASDNLKATAVADFVVLMMLLGNDFVPKIPNHTQIYETGMALIESYYEIDVPLTYMQDDNMYAINYKTMMDILNLLSTRQKTIIGIESKSQYDVILKDSGDPTKYYRNSNRMIEASLIPKLGGQENEFQFIFSRFRRAWYSNALGNRDSNFPRGFEAPIVTDGDIDDMCKKYLQTIAWVLRYYQTIDINSLWFYGYSYAPLWMDVHNYMLTYDWDDLDQPADTVQPIYYNALDQLISVIPPVSMKTCIPNSLYSLYTDFTLVSVYLPTAVIEEKDGLLLSIGDIKGRKDEGHLSTIIIAPVNIVDIFIAVRYELGVIGKIIDKFSSIPAKKFVDNLSGEYYLNEIKIKKPYRFEGGYQRTKHRDKPKDTRPGVKVVSGVPENVDRNKRNLLIQGQNYRRPSKREIYNPSEAPSQGYVVGITNKPQNKYRERKTKGKKTRKKKNPVVLM